MLQKIQARFLQIDDKNGDPKAATLSLPFARKETFPSAVILTSLQVYGDMELPLLLWHQSVRRSDECQFEADQSGTVRVRDCRQ